MEIEVYIIVFIIMLIIAKPLFIFLEFIDDKIWDLKLYIKDKINKK